MKQQVKYEIKISVDFDQPETALEYFTSEEFRNNSDHEFETMGDVAAVISQLILRDGLGINDSRYIDDIGTFQRDEATGEYFLAKSEFGEISIKFDQPYYTAIEIENAAGNQVKEFDGVTYEQIGCGSDASCDDCHGRPYDGPLCKRLCGGDPFECPAHLIWKTSEGGQA